LTRPSDRNELHITERLIPLLLLLLLLLLPPPPLLLLPPPLPL